MIWKKAVAISVISFIVLFAVTLLIYALSVYDKNEDIEYEATTGNIVYDEKIYYIFSGNGAFDYVHPFYCHDDLEKLEYVSSVFGYATYYADQTNDPTFIMMEDSKGARSIWFPGEELIYEEQFFTVSGTASSFQCKNCYIKEDSITQPIYYEPYIIAEFEWYLERAPLLCCMVNIYEISGEYYMYTGQAQDPSLYKCTPDFVNALRLLGILH
jgi:hypothetical protein